MLVSPNWLDYLRLLATLPSDFRREMQLSLDVDGLCVLHSNVYRSSQHLFEGKIFRKPRKLIVPTLKTSVNLADSSAHTMKSAMIQQAVTPNTP